MQVEKIGEKKLVVDKLLQLPDPIDKLSRENPKLLYWIEEIINDKINKPINIGMYIKKYIISVNPKRELEGLTIDAVIKGYLQGVKVVVNNNDKTAEALLSETRKQEIETAMKKTDVNNFDINKLNLAEATAVDFKTATILNTNIRQQVLLLLGTEEDRKKLETTAGGKFLLKLMKKSEEAMDKGRLREANEFLKTIYSLVNKTSMAQNMINIEDTKAKDDNDKIEALIRKKLDNIKPAS